MGMISLCQHWVPLLFLTLTSRHLRHRRWNLRSKRVSIDPCPIFQLPITKWRNVEWVRMCRFRSAMPSSQNLWKVKSNIHIKTAWFIANISMPDNQFPRTIRNPYTLVLSWNYSHGTCTSITSRGTLRRHRLGKRVNDGMDGLYYRE